nr:hypothetical protein [Clostridia bacterium]
MKRIISLLLTLCLLLTATAMAETPDKTTVTLEEAGITLDMPSNWYFAVAGQSEGSNIAQLFGLSGDILDSILAQNGFTIYATLDTTEQTTLSLSVVPGTSLIDMRSVDVDMDSVMEGFVSSFTVGEVVDSGVYQTEESSYIRIQCAASVQGGTADLLIYACNVNGLIYVFTLIAYPGADFPVEDLEAIVDSIRFID